jgi:hypothetical protein
VSWISIIGTWEFRKDAASQGADAGTAPRNCQGRAGASIVKVAATRRRRWDASKIQSHRKLLLGFEPGGEACWRDAADGLRGFVGRINHLADWPNAAETRVSYAKTGYWARCGTSNIFCGIGGIGLNQSGNSGD